MLDNYRPSPGGRTDARVQMRQLRALTAVAVITMSATATMAYAEQLFPAFAITLIPLVAVSYYFYQQDQRIRIASPHETTLPQTGSTPFDPAPDDTPKQLFLTPHSETDPGTFENERDVHPRLQGKRSTTKYPQMHTSLRPAFLLNQTATERLFILGAGGQSEVHGHYSLPREDAHAFISIPGAPLACAVADGLGTTMNAHTLSELAARRAVEILARRSLSDLPDHEWALIAEQIVAEITSTLPIIEPAGPLPPMKSRTSPQTTLVAALVEPLGSGLRCLWLSVGDSAVGVLPGPPLDMRWLAGEGYHDEPVSHALPSKPTLTASGVERLPADETFILATDGMLGVLEWNGNDQLRSAIASGRAQKSAIPALAELVDLYAQGRGDDRTVIAVGRLT